MIDEVQVARDAVSATLADRLVATLDDQPFLPTAEQLGWVDGGDLIAGREDGPLARIVAGRYASLFANHVIRDVSADGAPGAYIRIFECARRAFLRSLSGGAPPDPDELRWENEGGATRKKPDTIATSAFRARVKAIGVVGDPSPNGTKRRAESVGVA